MVEPVLCGGQSAAAADWHIGGPPNHDLRSFLDAVLYVNRTGIPWGWLPHVCPHWNTVYAYFARWQEEGVFDQLNSLLRRQVRRQEGRDDEPTACVIDSQSIKSSTTVHATGQGIGAGKKIAGRKRIIVVDSVGLLLGVLDLPVLHAGKDLLDAGANLLVGSVVGLLPAGQFLAFAASVRHHESGARTPSAMVMVVLTASLAPDSSHACATACSTG